MNRPLLVIVMLSIAAMVPGRSQTSHELPRRGVLGAVVVARDGAVTIARVLPGSAADSAGLSGGDVVVSLDGSPVSSVPAFLAAIRHPAGTTVTLTIRRDGETLVKTIAQTAAPLEQLPGTETLYGALRAPGRIDADAVTKGLCMDEFPIAKNLGTGRGRNHHRSNPSPGCGRTDALRGAAGT